MLVLNLLKKEKIVDNMKIYINIYILRDFREVLLQAMSEQICY